MFEGDAEEAINFYITLFPDSEIINIVHYGPDQPGKEGTVQMATFKLAGNKYMAIDSPMNHEFTFTPSVSQFVECESDKELEMLFSKLSDGGEVLMPLDNYGFSTRYGWLNDRYGVSWQLNYE